MLSAMGMTTIFGEAPQQTNAQWMPSMAAKEAPTETTILTLSWVGKWPRLIHSPFAMGEFKWRQNSQKETGSGRPSGCFQSTKNTELGQQVEKSTSWKAEATWTIHPEELRHFPQLFTGALISQQTNMLRLTQKEPSHPAPSQMTSILLDCTGMRRPFILTWMMTQIECLPSTMETKVTGKDQEFQEGTILGKLPPTNVLLSTLNFIWSSTWLLAAQTGISQMESALNLGPTLLPDLRHNSMTTKGNGSQLGALTPLSKLTA